MHTGAHTLHHSNAGSMCKKSFRFHDLIPNSEKNFDGFSACVLLTHVHGAGMLDNSNAGSM